MLARLCQELGSGAVLAAAGLGAKDIEVWGSLLAGALFLWISKRAAAAGWWRMEGAWVFGVCSLIFLLAAAAFGLRSWGWASGWFGVCLWACLWPVALARLKSKGVR